VVINYRGRVWGHEYGAGGGGDNNYLMGWGWGYKVAVQWSAYTFTLALINIYIVSWNGFNNWIIPSWNGWYKWIIRSHGIPLMNELYLHIEWPWFEFNLRLAQWLISIKDRTPYTVQQWCLGWILTKD
jgi:hypothetical protein